MSLITEVETILRGKGMPYIAVDEAKKALFQGARLDAFHFVVYFPAGQHWLLQCGERRAKKLTTMREWLAIFGEGFNAIFAVDRAAGVKFIDIDGNPIVLDAGAEPRSRELGAAPTEPGRVEKKSRRVDAETPSRSGHAGNCLFIPSSASSQLSLFGVAS